MLNYFKFWFIGSPIKRKKKNKKRNNSQSSDDEEYETDNDSTVVSKKVSLTTVSELLFLKKFYVLLKLIYDCHNFLFKLKKKQVKKRKGK